MKRYLVIYHKICLNRTEKVGLAKDWWDMSQDTAWYRGKIQRVYKAFTVVHKMKRFLLINKIICLNRTEKVGLVKDWWDMSQETAWYMGEKPEGLQSAQCSVQIPHYLLIYHEIYLNRTEKVGLAKDWWDISQETAWYRGEKPEGLQIGEPFPNSHVSTYIFIFQPKIFITFHISLSQN